MNWLAKPYCYTGFAFAVLLSSLFVLCGCSSLNKPASASFASVTIANRNADEIRRTTAAVFTEVGYQTYSTVGGDLVFEKEGSRKNQIAHGGWLEDSSIKERVPTEIVSLVDGSLRLQCRAYMVRHARDDFFEEEVGLANFRAGPYQKLLDKVAAQLK